jgi:hypothetical protein
MKLKCPRLPKGISKKELAKGIKVELEHTDDHQAATCIAKVHLNECPTYYRRLEKMEKACQAK